MKAEFDPVAGKTAIIIETIMSSPDIPSDPGLEFKIRLCGLSQALHCLENES